MSEYADRDHGAQGEHYVRHVSAMTAEGLHAKSAIAAELAHRDIEIAALRKRAEEAEADAQRYRWLKSCRALELRSDGTTWTREDGTRFVSSHFLAAGNTQHAPAETLDAAIDAARKETT